MVELHIRHPPLLVHPNRRGKYPLLVVSKPVKKTNGIFSHSAAVTAVESCQCGVMHSPAALLPKIPVQASGDLVADLFANGGFGLQDVWPPTHPRFASIERNLCHVDVENLKKHFLVKNESIAVPFHPSEIFFKQKCPKIPKPREEIGVCKTVFLSNVHRRFWREKKQKLDRPPCPQR